MYEEGEWFLTKMVLAAAKLAATKTEMMMSDEQGFSSIPVVFIRSFHGVNGEYQIFGIKSDDKNPSPLVATKDYRFYLVKLPSGGIGLMKLASLAENNSRLDHEWSILTELNQLARQYDQDAISEKVKPYNYAAIFPDPLEKFDAEGRTAFIVGFNEEISEFKQLSPISVILKDKRVDLQTCVWIMGKLLKLLIFIHENDYTNLFIRPSNILIETSLHGVFCLDWLYAHDSEESVSTDYQSDIREAADLVWKVAGGTVDSSPPHDTDLLNKDQYDEYVQLLKEMQSASQSVRYYYQKLYSLSDRIWPKVPTADGNGLKRQFHQFVTYDLNK